MTSIARIAPSWTLKPIFGREMREKVMNDFFKALPDDLAKLNAHLLKETDRYKFRLLCREEDQKPEGIVVYRRELQGRCLRLHVLSPIDLKTRAISHLYGPLIAELKKEARDLRASSIEFAIPRSEADVAYALHQNQFRRLDDKVKIADVECDVLSLSLEEAKHLKRRREETEEGNPMKKPRIDESKSISRPKQNDLVAATLMKKYIHMIRNGSKTIEGRINTGMFRNSFKEGIKARFFYMADPTDDVVCKVLKIVRYNSFREMLVAEGFKKCVPDAYSLDHAVEIYDKIPGYREKAERFGVLAIHLQSLGTSKND